MQRPPLSLLNRATALAASSTLLVASLLLEAHGAPAGKGLAPRVPIATNAFATNGIVPGSMPVFRLPTREDLLPKSSPGGIPALLSSPAAPVLDAVTRERLRQEFQDRMDKMRQAPLPVAGKPQIVERGAHHKVWETYRIQTNQFGLAERGTNSFVELGTGMHYQEDGEWKETKEEFKLHARGAAAESGAHKVYLSANAKTAGVFDVRTADGKRLHGHVLGLYYFDHASKKSVLLAEIQNANGEIHPPNQVVYPDAFKEIKADLRYTYTKAGFEQDVILREKPPAPEDYGMDPATTTLEVLTEFLNPPEPGKRPVLLKGIKGKNGQPDVELRDELLSFGTMMMGAGKAFKASGVPGPANRDEWPVGKRWFKQGGRHFLSEGVEFERAKQILQQLPKPEAAGPAGQRRASLERLIPTQPEAVREAKALKVASLPYRPEGLVVDYILGSSSSNFTFRGDTTYYVNTQVLLDGTTTIEGGSVIKSAYGAVQCYGPVVCKTGPYQPAVFTCWNDDSVGEILPDSDGNPAIIQNVGLLRFHGDLALSGLRFKYLVVGAMVSVNPATVTLDDVQFLHCERAMSSSYTCDFTVNNVLLHKVQLAFHLAEAGHTATVRGRHWTVNECGYLAGPTNIYATNLNVHLTNSLIVNLTNSGGWTMAGSNSVVFTTNSVFETAGSAAHYLPTNSSYRSYGTTNIGASLLQKLARKTTQAPLILTGAITNHLLLKPVAKRYTSGAPDLGYHYDPLDHALGLCYADAGVKVLVTAGTAVGAYNNVATNTNFYGLYLWASNSTFESRGTPVNPVKLVCYNTVQEQANTNWNPKMYGSLLVYGTDNVVASRFTDWHSLAGRPNQVHSPSSSPLELIFEHNQFHSGQAYFFSSRKVSFNHCLFNRTGLTVFLGQDFALRNSSLYGGQASLVNWLGAPHVVSDTLFHGSTNSGSGITGSHNVYAASASALTSSTNDLSVAGEAFVTGPLGYFYLGTNSQYLNCGSTNATNVGLYHFTTTTNQTKEGTSTVDRGFHYVAVNGSGLPVDTDGDGLPDHFEDWNGNGVENTAETSFTNAYTYHASLHDSLVDLDYDGVPAGQEYQAGTDPTDGAKFVFEPRLLGRWRFDTGALTGDQGQVPRYTNNVSLVSSWNTNAVLLSGSNTLIRLLNIDYGPNPDTNYYKWGVAAYGLATNDYWYPYYNPWVTDVTVTNLSWSTGSGLPVGSSLRVQNAPGQWGSETGDNMYNGYVYDWNSQGIANTYKGLPPGLYDLYLYGHGAWDDQNTGFSVFTSTRDFGSKNTIVSANWASINWSNTLQYVLFTNTTLLDGQPLQINAIKLASAYTCINGMQLANRVASQLAYKEVEASGAPNIYLKRGTAMFWIKPDWTSGTGPGHEGRLLEVGEQGSTNGWWALYCSTNGGELKFAGKSGSNTSNYFTCSIGWSNVWIHVALTYTETNSVLYVNGAQATNGAGVTLLPDQAMRFMSGLNVGGDVTGWNNLRGQMDELEIYNYPLTAGEVSSAYSTMASRDSDYDGLTDRFEHQYGLDYLTSTDSKGDSDYDGRTLLQEQAENTDPRSGTSMAKVRLGYWRFDTDALLGEQGQAPKHVDNVTTTLSWDGKALRSEGPGGTYRHLSYRDVETNGNANINCRQGSVSFWFRPAWSSTNLGGTGPGSWGRLIELGQWAYPATDGNWLLHLDPTGTQIFLYSQTNGTAAAYLWPVVSFTSNYWHHLVVTYGPGGTAIYLDGQLAQTGSGVTVWPGASVRAADGFSIGSDRYGSQRAVGDFEGLETFNYPLSGSEVSTIYSADFDSDLVPGYLDARPRDSSVGAFTVTIETPAAGSVIR